MKKPLAYTLMFVALNIFLLYIHREVFQYQPVGLLISGAIHIVLLFIFPYRLLEEK